MKALLIFLAILISGLAAGQILIAQNDTISLSPVVRLADTVKVLPKPYFVVGTRNYDLPIFRKIRMKFRKQSDWREYTATCYTILFHIFKTDTLLTVRLSPEMLSAYNAKILAHFKSVTDSGKRGNLANDAFLKVLEIQSEFLILYEETKPIELIVPKYLKP